MLLGIDVGGTYTDGIILEGSSVIASIKRPTENNNLKNTLLNVIDDLLNNINTEKIERLVLSTTLVTNVLATGSGEKTALLLIPGPGLPYDSYNKFDESYFIKGSIDFRGRILEDIDKGELSRVIDSIYSKGIKKLAVVGKFSNRNNHLEKIVRKFVLENYPEIEVVIGSEVAGQLNFMRRAVTTYYSVMTQVQWINFVEDIEAALQDRNLKCPVDILKADGGTMPLEVSKLKPCETVFSGPAASTMGAVALTMNKKNSVVLDIGGTTTDISLLIEGQPLYASRGALINDLFTHIKAISVNSLALGGDSPLFIENKSLVIGKQRKGPAACLGGNNATVTDVFNYSYDLNIGDKRKSVEKLGLLAVDLKMDIDKLAEKIVIMVTEKIVIAIQDMFKQWENEPAYKVWEVVNGREFKAEQIIGIGAAARAIVPVVAEKMNTACFLHSYSPVANALGACIARPTISLNLHVDTEKQLYAIDQQGIVDHIEMKSSFQLEDAKSLARTSLVEIAKNMGIQRYVSQLEFFKEEQFNMIRGWSTVGKIFEIGIQIKPGLIEEYRGVEI